MEEASATDLVKEVVEDARELVKIELALARRELQAELLQAHTAAIALAVGTIASSVGLSMIIVAIALATGAPAPVAAVVGVVLLVGAAIAIKVGQSALPKSLLRATARRLEDDVRGLESATHGA
jgi:hypothetical protein